MRYGRGILIGLVLAAGLSVVLSGAASFPSSVKSFTTKLAGDTIQATHINDLQDEVTAIETSLVNGTLPNAAVQQVLEAMMPVGFVVTLGVSTDPATLYGFGTWTAIAGRVIVGIDAGQTEFDTLDETGGAKTHTLQTTEIPSHSHAVTDPGHSHTQRVKAGGGATVDLDRATDRTGADANVTSTTASATTGITIGNAGGDGAHNNLQPYIVKYVWQRTT